MQKLTPLKVKNAKPGRYSDGGGLYLEVKDSGARSWMLRVQADGRRRDIGLGSASVVTLADARAASEQARGWAKQGLNPAEERKKARVVVPTFKKAATDCHEALKEGWRNKKHTDSWLACLTTHVFPSIGDRRVDSIDSIAVRDVLAPVWLTIPETARRILQRIGAVLDFAHIKGWRPNEISLRSVRKGLPRQPKRDNHYDAMPYDQVPAFLATLAAAEPTIGRDALQLTILTAVRSNETRFAVWPEFDLETGVWSIPAGRMKMNEPHVVPLSAPAIAILKRRYEGRADDGGLVFSSSGKKPISDMTMTKVLRDAKHATITVHGFRSAFTDWTAEMTDVPKEVADKALAHKLPDRVEAAYRRTDFFEKRRGLMDEWSLYLHGSLSGIQRA